MGLESFTANSSNDAFGKQAFAEGYLTQAIGDESHTEGMSTIANGKCQHVQGKYNIPDVIDNDQNGTYAHIVGNGTGDNNRSNAHTLDWDGNAWYAGRIAASEIKIGNTTFTEDQLIKILRFIDTINMGGN